MADPKGFLKFERIDNRYRPVAERVEDPRLITPSASIFFGSKTCLTCLWGWSICRDCFFWEAPMTLEACQQALGNCTQ